MRMLDINFPNFHHLSSSIGQDYSQDYSRKTNAINEAASYQLNQQGPVQSSLHLHALMDLISKVPLFLNVPLLLCLLENATTVLLLNNFI